ncbi:MAG: chemotaxis protein CheW [Vicinamibacterales bacterium]
MITTTVPRTRQATRSAGAERYVTFLLAGEIYAVPALSVREVMPWVAPARVPHVGASVKGVINLRGEIVTVLDLRTRLDLPPVEPTDRTCIIVVIVQRGAVRHQAGLIVDTALDVTRIADADVQHRTDAAAAERNDVAGMARTRSGLTIVLDVERLVLEGVGPSVAAEPQP